MKKVEVKTFDRKVSLKDIKILFKDNRIYIPVSVKQKYISEDGLSCGLTDDCGYLTEVEYSQVMGVLADDTVDMIKQQQQIKQVTFHKQVTFKKEIESLPKGSKLVFEFEGVKYLRCSDRYLSEFNSRSDATLYFHEIDIEDFKSFERAVSLYKERVSTFNELNKQIEENLKILRIIGEKNGK